MSKNNDLILDDYIEDDEYSINDLNKKYDKSNYIIKDDYEYDADFYEEYKDDSGDSYDSSDKGVPVLSTFVTASNWFSKVGIVVAIILVLYFLFFAKFIILILYIIGLVVAYFFGYFFMFLLERLIHND